MIRNIYYSLSTIELGDVDLQSDFTLVISFNQYTSVTLDYTAGAVESHAELAASFSRPRTSVRGLSCLTYRLRAIQDVLLVELHNWNDNMFETTSNPQLPQPAVIVATPAKLSERFIYPYEDDPIRQLSETWGSVNIPTIVV